MRRLADVPIAELERYGLGIDIINLLEREVGLYMDQLLAKRGEELLRISNFRTNRLEMLRDAVRRFLDEEEIDCAAGAVERTPPDPRRIEAAMRSELSSREARKRLMSRGEARARREASGIREIPRLDHRRTKYQDGGRVVQ